MKRLALIALVATAIPLCAQQNVSPVPATKPASYSASATVASASSATDIAVLPGNASNTVLVYGVRVSCQETTAGQVAIYIIKRSTADTAGTSSSMTAVKQDSNYAAASSAPLTYTANPTAGTAVGNLDVQYIGCNASATAGPNDVYVSPSDWKMKPIILHGTSDQLAVNLNSTTVTGGSFTVTFDWIEQ